MTQLIVTQILSLLNVDVSRRNCVETGTFVILIVLPIILNIRRTNRLCGLRQKSEQFEVKLINFVILEYIK